MKKDNGTKTTLVVKNDFIKCISKINGNVKVDVRIFHVPQPSPQPSP